VPVGDVPDRGALQQGLTVAPNSNVRYGIPFGGVWCVSKMW